MAEEEKVHKWPKDQTEHLFGPWKQYAIGKVYRMCIHPECEAHEIIDTPKG